MELKLSDREIVLPDSLGDLPLRVYFNIMTIMAQFPQEGVEEYFSTSEGQLAFFDIMDELIPDGIDNILVSDLELLTTTITKIMSEYKATQNISPVIEVNGVKYATRSIKDMNELTTGEYISIKMMQDRYKNVFEYAPYVLAILVRPCKEEKDEETGEIRYIQTDFDRKDMGNLEWRAKLFLNEARADDLMPVLNFFLNTNKTI